jgi:hypothetical protein
MHLFSHVRDSGHPNVSAHARFDLPDNPVCWLLGHRAKVKVVESRFASMKAWVRIDCRVCGRRYTPDRKWSTPSQVLMRQAGTTSPVVTPADLYRLEQELQAEMAARHVELARTNPAAIVESASGREGYATTTLELNAELHWRGLKGLKRGHGGVRLHTGTRGSETPLDAHVDLGFAAGYFSVGGVLGRWCHFLGGGHGRDLSLSVHGGHLWWKLWYDGDSGNDEHHRCDKWRRPPWPWSLGRRKYRGWLCARDGSIELNPLDAWFGSPKYDYDKSEPWREALVDVGQFPGDRYLVRFRREPYVRQREHGPRWARRPLERGVGVEFDAVIREAHQQPGERSIQPGIPYRNHDWKGDEVCSGGVRPPAGGWPEGEWLPAAVEALIAQIKADRVRYDYRPPAVRA